MNTSDILATLFITLLFLSALIFMEINRLEYARNVSESVQTYAEEKRLSENFDALLKTR